MTDRDDEHCISSLPESSPPALKNGRSNVSWIRTFPVFEVTLPGMGGTSSLAGMEGSVTWREKDCV